MKNFVLTKLIFALLLALVAASGPGAHGQSSAPNEEAYVTNGPVRAIALTADQVILGGDFNRVGAYCGGGVPLSAATGKAAGVFPKINGTVRCCVADGKGGWFVGGTFDKVGYLPRKNLAHILPTGRVDEDFDIAAGGTVQALALSGNTLYAGGSFTTLGGQDRKRIAAINLLTGTVSGAFNPNADGEVSALAVSGATVYACGYFSHIGGKARHAVAALNAATGAASVWDAQLASDGRVLALAVSGSRVYVGGSFSFADGVEPSKALVAALDATSGAVKDWSPYIGDGQVLSMSLAGSTLYLGGGFLGGRLDRSLLALDTATGQLRGAWPVVNASVNTVLASGTKLFVGGQFSEALQGLDGAGSTLGTTKRNYLASIDIATGAVSTWNPNPDGAVYALAASGATVFVGGDIRSVNAQNRTGLAALDAVTGEVTSWNPALSKSGIVNHLAVGGSMLYVEGLFSSIGGQARTGLGAVDLASGAPTAWSPPPITSATLSSGSEMIKAMAVAGGKVYVGGNFTRVGGEARKYLVALDPATGAATGPDLAVNDLVWALSASGSMLYAGGAFTSFGGQVRNRIAALDAASGAITVWNPDADGTVLALAAGSSQVYAAGVFQNIGSQPRAYFAALDKGAGAATKWNPRLNTNPLALALSGSKVFMASHRPITANGLQRNGLFELDGSSIPAAFLPWNPPMYFVSEDVTLAASDMAVYVGSTSTNIGGTGRPYFAKFDIRSDPARLSLSATSLDFLKGTRYAVDVERGGAPTTRTLTLTNAGSDSLVFTEGDAATPGLAITGAHAGDFKILSVRPSTLTPLEAGESVTVTVQFAPAAARRTLGLDAMLEVKTDSPVTPDLYIPLTGDAVPVRLSGFEAE